MIWFSRFLNSVKDSGSDNAVGDNGTVVLLDKLLILVLLMALFDIGALD